MSCAQHITDVPIAINQVEFHPWFQRPELIEYCHDSGTVVEAAAPLARAEVFDDDVVVDLASKYDKTPAQVVIRWALDRDVTVLPRSSSPAHIENNIATEWSLFDQNRERLNERDREYPVYDTPTRDWTREFYGIET